jgi:hypothetical protein
LADQDAASDSQQNHFVMQHPQDRAFGYTVFWWDEIIPQENEEPSAPMTQLAEEQSFMNNFVLFAEAELKGYAIVDTGATKSMSGLNLLLHVQEEFIGAFGEDHLSIDPTRRTRFTYANGESGNSFGRVGIPHRLALDEQDQMIWFTAVGTPSPMLLGLDWLEQAQATVDTATGLMTFADGTAPEQLVRLSTGHWALSLLDYE